MLHRYSFGYALYCPSTTEYCDYLIVFEREDFSCNSSITTRFFPTNHTLTSKAPVKSKVVSLDEKQRRPVALVAAAAGPIPLLLLLLLLLAVASRTRDGRPAVFRRKPRRAMDDNMV